MRIMRMRTLGLSALAFVALFTTASAVSAMDMLDWSTVTWNPGDMTHTYPFAPNVDVTITVSTSASMTGTPGSFTGYSGIGPTMPLPCASVTSPNKDGSPAPATYPTNRFGTSLDLGILFDPAVNNNQSVLIDINFTAPTSPTPGLGSPRAVPTLKFQISDIDWSQAGTDCVTGLANEAWRRDQVVITADNNGSPVTTFSLTPLTGVPTFTVSPANTATANGTRFGGSASGTASAGDDNGTVTVDFGASLVTHVRITYNEAAFGQLCDPAAPQGCVGGINVDPGYRGIGLFGLTMFPVELMEFTVE